MLSTPVVQGLPQRLERGGVCTLPGVARGAQAVVPVLLRRMLPEPTILVVCDGLKSQEQYEQDLGTWLKFAAAIVPGEVGDSNCEAAQGLFFYPDWEILPHENRLPHADVISDRLAALMALGRFGTVPGAARVAAAGEAPLRVARPIIVANVLALMQATFAPEEMRARSRGVRRGEVCDPLDLIEWLEAQGYEPEAQVTQKGELSLRGGILDVFPLTSPWPVRLEFFGNEVESLRWFDPGTQLSRDTTAEVVFGPAGELGMLKQQLESALPGSLRPPLASLSDHLPANTVVILAEPEAVHRAAGQYSEQVPPDHPFHIAWEEVRAQWCRAGLCQLELGEGNPETPVLFGSLESFRSMGPSPPSLSTAEVQRQIFFDQIQRWLRQGYQVGVVCNNEGEQRRFSEIWGEVSRQPGIGPAAIPAGEGFPEATGRLPPLETPTVSLELRQGALSRGFLFEAGQLVIVTDAEVFGRYRVARTRRLRSLQSRAMTSALDVSFSDLQEGDYVVHVQHGIGRYLGLQILPPSPTQKRLEATEGWHETAQECLVIEYAPREPRQPPPKLYVPVTEAHLVSKYVGAGRARPVLNTLGGGRWIKLKAQAERAVRDLASELLAIQASRAAMPGHAFPPDTPWQREFEASFLYEETPDQLRAIEATKGDLEAARPMDRLICGDVGFGKTEVALRAAFKVVMGGRQAAILVPTTVLAQQHYNTFRERLADYPVRVELLSRFRSRPEQARVLRDLAGGSVDIVIGTHRLVQDDVRFKELGLVVIDEEQRFGVIHKEKFKLLRRLVDVLTLSATPIPRTLYLALTGTRDMSTLETPPQDRLPVETHVVPHDERIIRDAIRRELNRQGQVFYLHNRVDTIATVGQRLRTLVPEARLAIGHGQMKSHELEEVMTRFVNGEIDVLLSTTIIESGLDIPNANTIIIDRADRFGLSDLYQLRGRVGRYKHQAFAYFLLPRHATLLADARKRISAIRQYSSLGSGFKIALRDLEIRGAGNLLGVQQSGHITAVGFELYCQLLKQSVRVLKGQPVKPTIHVKLRLDFLHPDPQAESPGSAPVASSSEPCREPVLDITVPREVATIVSVDRGEDDRLEEASQVRRVQAALPMSYIPDSQHRIELHRKLAQADSPVALASVRQELQDRFGPLPPAADLLLQAAELKLLAAARGITAIETRRDKLMLTRNQEYFMPGGKFPRLTHKSARGKLREIKQLLLA